MHALSALALDHCPDAVFVIRDDGGFAYVNRTACQWLHYRREELLELALWDVDPNYTSESWDANWQVLKENRVMAVKSEHRRRDGSTFPVEIVVALETFAEDNGRSSEVIIAYARNSTNPLGQLEVTVRGVLRERALSRLNSQERSVFDLLERDESEKEITQRLGISRSTFYRIKRRISAKLGIDGKESNGFWW